uniref:Putative motA/TolQ/ExbB proton channel n=1 Tax=uncultured bacterium fosmid pJB71G8 TaxID=1478068 RepID=A0A0H3UAJ6_9BACT|nr:putative motA/TolQ/ExbB proton channel [uncultured bacterium fosmid pJB71G8]
MAEQANIQKPAAPKKADNKAVNSNVGGVKNASIVILVCFILAVCFFVFVLGNGSHFKDGDNANAPLDILGTIYKGGVIVPVLQTLFLSVIVLTVERWIALAKAKGTGNIAKFVAEVKKALAAKDINKAEELCRKQKGTVGAVVYATLQKYKEMETADLAKEQKLALIQGQLEEATALEMPSLQQNLPIVATMTTLGTLIGLLGTVLGMIKSFQALSASGAPDSTELSTGISEALVNTAFGIATAALALISYNFFTNKIDNMTYAIDELGFSIVTTFSATH